MSGAEAAPATIRWVPVKARHKKCAGYKDRAKGTDERSIYAGIVAALTEDRDVQEQYDD